MLNGKFKETVFDYDFDTRGTLDGVMSGQKQYTGSVAALKEELIKCDEACCASAAMYVRLNGICSIDFGTKSTIVVCRDGEVRMLRIGKGKYSEEPTWRTSRTRQSYSCAICKRSLRSIVHAAGELSPNGIK